MLGGHLDLSADEGARLETAARVGKLHARWHRARGRVHGGAHPGEGGLQLLSADSFEAQRHLLPREDLARVGFGNIQLSPEGGEVRHLEDDVARADVETGDRIARDDGASEGRGEGVAPPCPVRRGARGSQAGAGGLVLGLGLGELGPGLIHVLLGADALLREALLTLERGARRGHPGPRGRQLRLVRAYAAGGEHQQGLARLHRIAHVHLHFEHQGVATRGQVRQAVLVEVQPSDDVQRAAKALRPYRLRLDAGLLHRLGRGQAHLGGEGLLGWRHQAHRADKLRVAERAGGLGEAVLAAVVARLDELSDEVRVALGALGLGKVVLLAPVGREGGLSGEGEVGVVHLAVREGQPVLLAPVSLGLEDVDELRGAPGAQVRGHAVLAQLERLRPSGLRGPVRTGRWRRSLGFCRLLLRAARAPRKKQERERHRSDAGAHYSFTPFFFRSGWQKAHWLSGRSCSAHQSPFAL